MRKNTDKLILINDKFSGKKLFFLNTVGCMEQIWLLQPKSNTWEKLSPKFPRDLNARGYVNCYSQINNHVVTIDYQDKIFLIGYSDCDEINFYSYYPAENVWEKLSSPEVAPIFGTTKYDVIRTNVITIDEKPHISLLLRSSGGLSLYLYDITVGTWNKILGTPSWSDKNGWKDPSNYTTIETHVIKSLSNTTDNGGQNATNQQSLLIIGRAANGFELHCYVPRSKNWEELPQAQKYWGDNTDCKNYTYYSTFNTKIINDNDVQKLYVQMCFPGGICNFSYNLKNKAWDNQATTPNPNYNYSDQAGWVNPQYYSTMNTVVIKSQGQRDKIFLFIRGVNGIDLKFLDGNNWTATNSNLALSDAAGYNQHEYFSSIGVQSLADFDEASNDNLIAYTKSPISRNLEIYIYKVAENSWSKLIDGPDIFTQEWYNPSYYQTAKNIYENLCVAIKNYEIEQAQMLLLKDIDLFCGLRFKIILDNYKLYLIDTLDENNFAKIASIKEHALVLLNNNRIYFIKDSRIERDHNYHAKWITIADRKGFPNINQENPALQSSDKTKEFIEMVLSQLDLDLTVLKNATNIPIDYYQQSPIGLVLNLKAENCAELLGGLIDLHRSSNEFLRQVAVYFCLAAKYTGVKGLLLAKQLMNAFLAQNKKPDLRFEINKNIIDFSISGAKDFFEIAILNKNSELIEWILSDNYIKEGIFQPTIKHLQLAFKCLQTTTVQRLLELELFKLSELRNLLQSKFFADGNDCSYLEYIKNFNQELYMLLGKELFFTAVTEADQSIFVWLLEQGFWFDGCQHKLLPLAVLAGDDVICREILKLSNNIIDCLEMDYLGHTILEYAHLLGNHQLVHNLKDSTRLLQQAKSIQISRLFLSQRKIPYWSENTPNLPDLESYVDSHGHEETLLEALIIVGAFLKEPERWENLFFKIVEINKPHLLKKFLYHSYGCIRADFIARVMQRYPEPRNYNQMNSIDLIQGFGYLHQQGFRDFNEVHPISKLNPLETAIVAGEHQNFIKLLICGANLSQRNLLGETPLMIAIRSKNFDVARHLVEVRRVDPRIYNQTINAKALLPKEQLNLSRALQERVKERQDQEQLQLKTFKSTVSVIGIDFIEQIWGYYNLWISGQLSTDYARTPIVLGMYVLGIKQSLPFTEKELGWIASQLDLRCEFNGKEFGNKDGILIKIVAKDNGYIAEFEGKQVEAFEPEIQYSSTISNHFYAHLPVKTNKPDQNKYNQLKLYINNSALMLENFLISQQKNHKLLIKDRDFYQYVGYGRFEELSNSLALIAKSSNYTSNNLNFDYCYDLPECDAGYQAIGVSRLTAAKLILDNLSDPEIFVSIKVE